MADLKHPEDIKYLDENAPKRKTELQLAVERVVFPEQAPGEAKLLAPNNDPGIGPGGAPTRPTILPTDAKERKMFPVASGFLRYFPDAAAAISLVSYIGNEQHNPGMSLRWTRGKSQDEEDTMIRHMMQAGTVDADGVPHSWKMAWRALAIVQKEIEEMRGTLKK